VDAIDVLVVEDDPIAAEAHAVYVGRVPGFTVVGIAHSGAEAIRLLRQVPVDLVLLDIYLPDMHGLDVVREMRAAGSTADVIVATRAHDLAVVQDAVTYGIVHYVVKPFTFGTLREKLERYQAYRRQMAEGVTVAAQHDVDRLLASLHGAGRAELPKGMSRESFDAVVAALKGSAGRGMSAAEVAEVLGASRVTARRYLEYAAETGLALRQPRYRGAGRPEVEYRWCQEPDH
jgi:response regulator of citrate/malate metabolism